MRRQAVLETRLTRFGSNPSSPPAARSKALRGLLGPGGSGKMSRLFVLVDEHVRHNEPSREVGILDADRAGVHARAQVGLGHDLQRR